MTGHEIDAVPFKCKVARDLLLLHECVGLYVPRHKQTNGVKGVTSGVWEGNPIRHP